MAPKPPLNLAEVTPVVEQVIESLRTTGTGKAGRLKAEAESEQKAEALQAALDYANRAQSILDLALAQLQRSDTVPMAIPIESALHLRAYEGSTNLTADVIEGWIRFLNGEWEPVKPQRAPQGQGKAKSVLNMRASETLINEVTSETDRMILEDGWPSGRGNRLNARQIAVQWIARKYPASPESEAAAE